MGLMLENTTTVQSQPLDPTDGDFGRRWNEFIERAEYGHLQQGFDFAVFKSRRGWRTQFFWAETAGEIVSGAVVLRWKLPMSRLSVAAMPCGPCWRPGQAESLAPLLASVVDHCRNNGLVFCRISLPCPAERFERLRGLLPESGRELQHVWSYWNLARNVMVMDISGGREAVLSRMHRDSRMKVRRGQRRGLRLRDGSREDLPVFAALLRSMSRRKRVFARGLDYFQQLFDCHPGDRIALILAENEGEIVGGSLVVCLGQTAWYLYGAIDYDKRHLYPSELLQMGMIEWAQKRGCKLYDLGGTCTDWPPLESEQGYGVYRFKQRLGARVILRAPYCDLVARPSLYRLSQFAENVAMPLILEKGRHKIRVLESRLREAV